jgi:hypothetical protein
LLFSRVDVIGLVQLTAIMSAAHHRQYKD